MRLSVIVCTHDPRRDYLQRTLESLRAQTLPAGEWDLIMIDNASRDQLAPLWDLSWHPGSRHVREDQPGLTAARLRGIGDSSGDLLVFIDDDNVVAPDYLAKVEAIHTAHEYLGVFGAGRLEPEFEVPPAAELQNVFSLLALRTVSRPMWSNNPRDYGSLPWGAGLVVVRKVADRYGEFLNGLRIHAVLDRRSQRLFSGGDDLFSWAASRLGMGFGIFPELHIRHLISAPRLTREYFLRLIHDHAFSNAVMHCALAGDTPTRIDGLRRVRLLFHALRRGMFSAQCQIADLRGQAAAAAFIRGNQVAPAETELVARETGQHVAGLAGGSSEHVP